jgi:hypothetical protein
VFPSPDSATALPKLPAPVIPVGVIFTCWVHVVPERVNTNAAPLAEFSLGEPTSAVLPSADSATLHPKAPLPISPVPVSLGPCCEKAAWAVEIPPANDAPRATPTRDMTAAIRRM